jgi:CheY-like chemotaxis protein
MLTVCDTGPGMNSETLAHLFEPFFTTKASGKGTGLGLAVVYGIVQQSGGDIEVQSTHNHGTTFKIYLPRVGDALSVVASETLDPTPSYNVPVSSTETILLVEDEQIVRELIRNLLETEGYRVLEASTAEDAIRLCERCDAGIHLLLTDIVMPGMNGLELARRLQSADPGLRVLLISGYPNVTMDDDGVADTPVAFLPKPFRPEVLVAKVREVLDVS